MKSLASVTLCGGVNARVETMRPGRRVLRDPVGERLVKAARAAKTPQNP
jgi:hypothetical protein